MTARLSETVPQVWARHEQRIRAWEAEAKALPRDMPAGKYFDWCERKRRELAAEDARATTHLTGAQYHDWLEIARVPWDRLRERTAAGAKR